MIYQINKLICIYFYAVAETGVNIKPCPKTFEQRLTLSNAAITRHCLEVSVKCELVKHLAVCVAFSLGFLILSYLLYSHCKLSLNYIMENHMSYETS